jgi:hypothetical protein
MPIAPVAFTEAIGNISTATSPPINTVGANLISIAVASSSGTPTLTDSMLNTWIPRTERGSAGSRIRIFDCFNPLTDTAHTFTVTGGVGPSASIGAFSGVLAFDQESAGADVASGSAIQPGPLTPPEAGCLFVTGFSTNNNSTVADAAITAPFTKAANAPAQGGARVGSALGYLIQGAAGAEDPTWSQPGNSHIAATMVTYTPDLTVADAIIDQVVVELADQHIAELTIDQVMVEFAVQPPNPMHIDQCIVEYIPGIAPTPPGPPPFTPAPGCPVDFPVAPAGDRQCVPPWVP